MEKECEFIIADDPEHEKVFIEIRCLEYKVIARISQDQGPDHLMVEFPGPSVDESKVLRTIELNKFIKLLHMAAKHLVGDDYQED